MREVENLKRKVISILSLFLIFVFASCRVQSKKAETEVKKEKTPEKEVSLNIAATNRLLYNMVKDVVKDKNKVEYMFEDKEELFNFDYSEETLNNISKKDIFFYFGNGMEPWIEGFVDKLDKNKVSPVNVSRGVKIIPLEREITYKDKTIKDNPYFWVSTYDYKVAMLNIKNAIQDKDTKNRDIYESNFSSLIKEVDEYEVKLKDAAAKLKDYTFVVDGDELDYFIKNYGFKSLKIYNYGLIPTEEDKKKISEVEKEILEAKNVVFLYDTEERLKANEALVKKYNLDTSNIIVYKDDISYKEILKSNLENLEKLNPESEKLSNVQ